MSRVAPSVIGVGAGGATDTVKLPRVATDGYVCWTLIVARCGDKATRRIVIYIEVGAGSSVLVDKTPDANYDSVSLPGTVYLRADARICADFHNVDAGETVELYAYGYRIPA